MAAVDVVVLLILAAAGLRGLLRGLIREVFSVLALAGAVLAVRLYTDPIASQLRELLDDRIGSTAAWALAAVLLAIVVIAVVALGGSFLRRGARSVGLGWADRIGGGVLGVAEGGLVAAVLLLLAVRFVGSDAPTLQGARSVAALEELSRTVRGTDGPDVAAPPPEQRL